MHVKQSLLGFDIGQALQGHPNTLQGFVLHNGDRYLLDHVQGHLLVSQVFTDLRGQVGLVLGHELAMEVFHPLGSIGDELVDQF